MIRGEREMGNKLSSRGEGVGTMDVGLSLICASTQTSMREGRRAHGRKAEYVTMD